MAFGEGFPVREWRRWVAAHGARCPSLCALGVAAVLAVGCAPEPNAAWPKPRPLGRDIALSRPPSEPESDSAEGQASEEEPTGSLDLRRALALTLLRHPELATHARELRVQEARALQASVIPNPELAVTVEDWLGSGELSRVKQLQLTVELSQLIELGGKRAGRLAVARQTERVAGWEYETARIDVLTRVTKAFVDVLVAQQAVSYAKQNVATAATTLAAFRDREEAGKISALMLSRADLAHQLALLELEHTERHLQGARRELALGWGSTDPKFDRTVGELTPPVTIPGLSDLVQRVNANPQLARWAAVQAQREAEVELAEAGAYPDLQVAAGYRYNNGLEDSAVVMGLSVPLPLFDRNQGAVRAARHRLLQVDDVERASRLEVLTALSRAYQQLAMAHHEACSLRTTLLPSAQKTHSAMLEGYRLGRFTWLEVLDAQRAVFETRGRYDQALGEYHKAVADVERLIGDRLHSGSAKPDADGASSTAPAAPESLPPKPPPAPEGGTPPEGAAPPAAGPTDPKPLPKGGDGVDP